MLSAVEKEQGRRTPYPLTPGEILWFEFSELIESAKRIRLKPANLIGAGLAAAGGGTAIALSTQVEAAAPQSEYIDNLLSRVSIPEIPQISTPAATATPVLNAIGGRGFSVSSTTDGVKTSWVDGTIEKGYKVNRFDQNGVTIIPQNGMLSESSNAYTDFFPGTVASAVSNYVVSGYQVLPQGSDGQSLGRSDLLFYVRGIATTNAPGITLRLNESNKVTLNFNALNQGGILIPLGGEAIPLAPGTTSATHDTKGAVTCYILLAGTERTDVPCAIPGMSSFPDISSNLTLTPATPTATSTSTATRTATTTATSTISYYSQFLSVEGIVIKAPPSVNSSALERAKEKLLPRTSRADIRTTFVNRNLSVGIFSQTFRETPELSSVPLEFAYLPGWMGELRDGNLFLAIKESCLTLNPPCGYPQDYDPMGHELGHLVHFYGLPGTDRSTYNDTIYPKLAGQPNFPDSWRDLLYYPGPQLATTGEFFAELTQVWPRKSSEVCARDTGSSATGICTFLKTTYPPR